MIQSQDLHRQAEVMLRITLAGADPRPRSTKVAPDRLTAMRHTHLVIPMEAIAVDADPADPRTVPMDVLVYLPNQGEPLDQYAVGGVSPDNRMKVLHGILAGLEHLHGQGITHGNLKPSNILVQRLPHAHAALCDFGFTEAYDYRNAILQWPANQLAYISPEQLAGKTPAPNADFWALGLIAYELVTGRYLFGSSFSNNTELVARIEAADFPQDIGRIPEPYQNLLRACLTRDPKQRPSTVAQLRDILAGKIRWEGGKAVPVPAQQQAPAPPPEVRCPSCGQSNPAGTRVCGHCAAVISGPAFLNRYKRSNALAVWTLIWFGMFLLPIGFFYYGLYQVESMGVENQNTWDKLVKVIDWYNEIAPDHSSYKRNYQSGDDLTPKEQAAVVIAVGFGCYFFVFGSLWQLFQLLWTWRVSNNLNALGASNRVYHPWLMLLCVAVMILGAFSLLIFPPLALVAFPVATILPLLILQEVWRGSNPNYLQVNGGWKRAKGSFLILSWWLLSLVFPVLLILPILPVGFFEKMGFDWSVSLNWFYVTIGILVAYCVMYGAVLARVNFRQWRKYNAWLGR